MDFFNRNYVHICFDIHALFPVEYLMHLQNRKKDIAIDTTTTVPKGICDSNVYYVVDTFNIVYGIHYKYWRREDMTK